MTRGFVGKPVETLEDVLRDSPYVVCVGINPSLVTVEAGHYDQDRTVSGSMANCAASACCR